MTEFDYKLAEKLQELAHLLAEEGMRLQEVKVVGRVRPSLWVETITGPVTTYFSDKEPSPWLRAMHAVDEYKSAMRECANKIKDLGL